MNNNLQSLKKENLLNGYIIFQDPNCFMFGIDAVLLSAFASFQINKKDRVIDLCSGNGIIPLLLCNYCKEIYGLEILEKSALLAKKSVIENNLEKRIFIQQGDLKNSQDFYKKHSFNVVTCNPPYMINNHGKNNINDEKTIARHEILCNLEDVIKAADYLTATHGKFFMIHKAFRLNEIFVLLNKYNFEPKRMQLIQPFKDEEPNLVLIEARKNANPNLVIEKSLIVYEKPGDYTKQVLELYERCSKSS